MPQNQGLRAHSRARLAALVAAVALIGSATCGPKKYVPLTPDEDHSDSPALVVKVTHATRDRGGAFVVALSIVNRDSKDLDLATTKAALLDADDNPMEPEAPLAGLVAAGESAEFKLRFNTSGRSKGLFTLQLSEFPVKVWPIVFSREKAPDFKETPTPDPSGGGPPRGPY